MNQNELLAHSDEMHSQGEQALKSSGIVDVLKKYGSVSIHGGFSYNLLLKPDIDIHLIAPGYKKDMPEELVCKLIKENRFVEVLYIDHNEHNPSITKHTGRVYPDGHYIGLKYFYQEKMWTFDIFILDKEQAEIEGLQKYFNEVCTERTRAEILKSKLFIKEKKINYPPKKMYDLFIDGTLQTSEDFKELIKNEKIQF
jgi:hypothetical protein